MQQPTVTFNPDGFRYVVDEDMATDFGVGQIAFDHVQHQRIQRKQLEAATDLQRLDFGDPQDGREQFLQFVRLGQSLCNALLANLGIPGRQCLVELVGELGQ